jgi:hypothetical protein
MYSMNEIILNKRKEKISPKVLITGTGRCGTTFLIKLFTFLGYDTGYTVENYKDSIFTNCNSGMERAYNEKPYILKNPNFMENIEKIVNDKSINIRYVIMPIRDLEESAKSREEISKKPGILINNTKPGGLWNANNKEEQIEYYKKIINNYMAVTKKYNIKTIFIKFKEMINNPNYLYKKLFPILLEKAININTFTIVYKKTSETSKPTTDKT